MTTAADKDKAKQDAPAVESTDDTKHEPFVISGRAGQAFNIDGEGFGSGGTLTIGGQPVATTRWNDKSIKGVLPAGISGEVVVKTGDGKDQKGVFPQPKVVSKTTTTTVVETVNKP